MNETAVKNDLKNKIANIQPIHTFYNTYHENLFAWFFPDFKRQVAFGTGKGGMSKWGTKKFTVDFYDPETRTAYEINGDSHNRFYNTLVDELKKRFLSEKGITIKIITNKTIDDYYDFKEKEGEIFE